MTDQQHPIKVPSELLVRWRKETPNYGKIGFDHEQLIADKAAQWGADQELDACCAEMSEHWGNIHNAYGWELSQDLRAARRPEPSNLKEQALQALNQADNGLSESEWQQRSDTIRRALESLSE